MEAAVEEELGWQVRITPEVPASRPLFLAGNAGFTHSL
jgi:hypothetical protein